MEPNNRRGFIKTLVLSAASLVVLPGLSSAESAATYVDIGAEAQFGSDWTRVVLPVQYNQEVIFVRKEADAAKGYQAISARCTHRGCVVAYLKDQHQFLCPCHHGRFDDNGVNISGPPPRPLNSLTTKVVKSHVLVAAPWLPS